MHPSAELIRQIETPVAIPSRILFFAEAVTLAHVARPIVLASALDADRFEVVLACNTRYQQFLERMPWQTLPLHSIDGQRFLRALERGSPVYDVQTLRGYVREDIELIEQVNPDVIVGDFRLSLSVSARLAKVPYVTITNAYWSPHYTRRCFPLPVLPMTKILPIPVAAALFRLAQPLAFSFHSMPLNRVRREHGLPSLGSDLTHIYTDADYVLYADVPELLPTANLPANHKYLGPILWSPPVANPEWWDNLPTHKPIIYVTFGSSGQTRLLPLVLQALADLPVTVIAAAIGAPLAQPAPTNAYVADYLPGVEAAKRSSLVICNGGSLVCQQALAAGVPVLGIANNMDQFMNIASVVDAGAGIMMRADRARAGTIQEAVTRLMSTADFKASAQEMAITLARYDAQRRFAELIANLVGEKAS